MKRKNEKIKKEKEKNKEKINKIRAKIAQQ